MSCKECGSPDVLAKDLCATCYGRQWRELHEWELKEYKSEYYQLHKEKWYRGPHGEHYQDPRYTGKDKWG